MPTNMKLIAKEAGVSVVTVSRAINNKPDISLKTKKKIIKIAENLHYTQNHLAKSLVTRKTMSIAILIPDNLDPFYAAILQGVAEECTERGYAIFLLNTRENPDLELEYLRRANEKRVDGILIYPVQADKRYLKEIEHSTIPFVFLNRHPESNGYDYVINDNVFGAYSAINHIINQGHKKIAYICPQPTVSSVRERIAGCKKAIRENGLSSNILDIIMCEEKIEICCKIVKEIVSSKNRPTALFIWDDKLAIGAMKAILEAGMNIPRDIAIVGYDDIEVSAYLHPALTTVRQPTYHIGETAAKILLDKLESKSNGDLKQIILKPELIIRSTT